MSANKPASAGKEATFRSYTSQQGSTYAQYRPSYNTKLFDLIAEYHTSSGGELNTLVDVGCGPGQAVRDFAPRFINAYGLDPSEGMIATARSLGGETANSEPIQFEVSGAEDLGSNLASPIADGSVDVITAATAAHWFDMDRFWARAAQVLKPGGSVAVWTSANIRPDPSMANGEAITTAIWKLRETLKPYYVQGNLITSDLYIDLPLPWTVAEPVLEFDKASFFRKEWSTGGDSESSSNFFANLRPISLDALEMIVGTGSPVTRWKQANPGDVGTERDPVKIMRREIEESFREVGVEQGKELLTGGVESVLLMLKKKA
jgi:SAM-dependent methyltransferase